MITWPGMQLPPRHRRRARRGHANAGSRARHRGSAHPTAGPHPGDDQRAGDAPQRAAVLGRRDEAHGAPGLAAVVALRDGVLGPVLRAVHHPRSTSSSRLALARRSTSRTRPIGPGPRHSRLVECSAGGRAPLIERYALPEIADLFTDEARFRRLARGRDPRHRGLGQARAWCPPPTRWRSGSGPTSPSTAIHERERITEHDVAAFVDVVQERIGGARRLVGPLRPHVERRRRHRPVGRRSCRRATS